MKNIEGTHEITCRLIDNELSNFNGFASLAPETKTETVEINVEKTGTTEVYNADYSTRTVEVYKVTMDDGFVWENQQAHEVYKLIEARKLAYA